MLMRANYAVLHLIRLNLGSLVRSAVNLALSCSQQKLGSGGSSVLKQASKGYMESKNNDISRRFTGPSQRYLELKNVSKSELA